MTLDPQAELRHSHNGSHKTPTRSVVPNMMNGRRPCGVVLYLPFVEI